MHQSEPITPLSKAGLSLQDRAFYMQVWRSRNARCECCDTSLYEPRLFMFHHILEKRKKKFTHEDYTMYRHCLWNIMLLCWECHDAYERNPETRPFVANAKGVLQSLLGLDFDHNTEDIWLKADHVDTSIIHLLMPGIILQLN